MVSAETAAQIEPDWLAEERDGAWLLRRLAAGLEPGAATAAVEGSDLESYVPRPLRTHLAVASGEAEHRQVTVAFLKVPGTDVLLAAEGAGALLDRLDAVADAVGRACDRYGLTWLESDIDVDAVKLYLTGRRPGELG